MNLEMIKALPADIGRALLAGICAAAASSVLFFVIGLLIGGGQMAAGLESVKNGLFVIAALLMFVLAGMLLMKGKKPEKKPGDNGWRRHFRVAGYKTVIAVIAAVFVAVASVADYVLLVMR